MVYLSGPMTGYPEHNFPAFFDAEARLESHGHKVTNPARLNSIGTPWDQCMRIDLRLLLDPQVTGLAFLPGWETSHGARLEVLVADGLGLPTGSVDEWLDGVFDA